MNGETLTIIVLTYNHEKTIAKALDSILSQKTDFRFIIKVAEDCSTDKTAEIIGKYSRDYPGQVIPIFRKRNVGVAQNFHEALSSVKTDFWAFLEGDDFWCDSQKLQLQVNALLENKHASMCGHETLFHLHNNDNKLRYIEQIQKIPKKPLYKLGDAIKVHPSARTYRTLDLYKDLPNKMVFDSAIYLLHLTKGPIVFIDRLMSVYNYTGVGVWSSKNKYEQSMLALDVADSKNQYFQGKYAEIIWPETTSLKILKKILGIKLGWRSYVMFKYFQLKLCNYVFS